MVSKHLEKDNLDISGKIEKISESFSSLMGDKK